jgi:hypothetical protein
MELIRRHKLAVGVGVLLATGLLAYLAFGFFGVHTLFIDDEVNEAGPVFASAAATTAITTIPEDQEPAADTETDESVAVPTTASDDELPATTEPVVETIARGSFEDSSIHSGSGDVAVLSDGAQSFLRFEDNFSTDNGPDLNVYLRAADGSFIDLGDLKGNIGSQNYELPAAIDLTFYRTVDIWCVRFGVSFTAAALS